MILFNDMTQDEKRAHIRGMLKEGIAVVEFVKVNGDHRMMPCTLSPEFLPAIEETPMEAVVPLKPARKENLDVIRAYAIDKQEWRSFRIDGVISVKQVSK